MKNYYYTINGIEFAIQWCAVLEHYSVLINKNQYLDGIMEKDWKVILSNTESLDECYSIIKSYSGVDFNGEKKYLKKIEFNT